MKAIAALACGLVFGMGLALSDMVNPARVIAFLDISGAWDPTLAYVMAGALIPAAIGFAMGRASSKPGLAATFHLPLNGGIDRRLLAGAALFGIGWGLVGLCPGPAIAGLALGEPSIWIFVVAMIAGIAAHRALARALDGRPSADGPPLGKAQ